MKTIVVASVTALVIASMSACAGEDTGGGVDETSNQPFIAIRDAGPSYPIEPIAVPPATSASVPKPPIHGVLPPYPRPKPDPMPISR